MNPEFKALGIDRSKRGRLFNEGLEFLNRAFSSDCIENGQEFMFLLGPRDPASYWGRRSMLLIGRLRTEKVGSPAGRNLEKLGQFRTERAIFQADKGEPEIAVFTRLAHEESEDI